MNRRGGCRRRSATGITSKARRTVGVEDTVDQDDVVLIVRGTRTKRIGPGGTAIDGRRRWLSCHSAAIRGPSKSALANVENSESPWRGFLCSVTAQMFMAKRAARFATSDRGRLMGATPSKDA